MNQKIYDDGDLEIWQRDGKYFLRYDAGAHQIAIREDEISKEEVELVAKSVESATKVLFAIQKRLEAEGIKPYRSNIK
ncbi:hypothetical protein ACMXYV_08120 [Neptuniibacter sp. SY11_33]|uniref:hypothetical protein n=1 Tax=unclassified Neptuniibacter TaxID=2630693 RepID=UPI0039F68641